MQSSPRARDPDDWWWLFDPRQSLRARAVLIFGGAALGFVLLTGWTAERLFHRHLDRQLGSTFETLAFQIGDKLDRALAEHLGALQLAAGQPALRDPARPPAEMRAWLDTLLDAAPERAWVGFADRDGKIVAATQRLFEGAEVATTPWFRGAQKVIYAGNLREIPDLAAASPNPAEDSVRFLDLAVPVTDADGNFLGVLATHLRWSLARDIQLSVVPETARRDHLGATVYSTTGDVLLDSGASGWTNPPEAPTVGDRPGLRGHLVETVAGQGEFLAGYARSRGHRGFRGANWLVVVRQPIAEAFADERDLRRWIVRLGTVFVLAVAMIAWVVAGRLARRLTAVAMAADKIRHGDILSLIPQPRGPGEIEAMCSSLGEMVENFRAKQEKTGEGQPPSAASHDKKA